MSTTTYSLKWDLDIFFKDGSESKEFQTFLENLKENISKFDEQIEQFQTPTSSSETEDLTKIIATFQSVAKAIRQSGAFVSCLQAQNTKDKKATMLRSNVTQLSANLQTALTKFDQKLIMIKDQVWSEILSKEPISTLSFVLNERRNRAKEKLSPEQEMLISSLAIDGYFAWEEMYDTIVGNMKIPFEEKGELKELSVGQAFNKFSNSDRNIRKDMFKEWTNAWEEQSDYTANTLNHLAGFRLNVYKQRGWENVLKEPLEINRMSQKTLDIMWDVITENKASFVKYLERKATLLGIEKLSWFDLDAPVGNTDSKVTYQEGTKFILEQFSKFGPKLANFAKNAFEKSWIEAEDRPGKSPGGFCTSFPESDESRIFMTFSGSGSNVSTLAHELGHAFHQFAMSGVHSLNRNYAMNVAETASTFAEMIVADAAVRKAVNKEERITLLEDKVQRSVAFYMNIHARFIFEKNFYEERKRGIVSSERLNELMLAAQKEAFCDKLDEYHPQFWASKLHFHITGVPFYNFPYTFGYLFSLGIYARALKDGAVFEEKYIALLKDTASMSVEELAMKHLGVDLTERSFWEKAVHISVKDVEEFLKLTN